MMIREHLSKERTIGIYKYLLFLLLILLFLDGNAQTLSSNNANKIFSLKVTGGKVEGWGYQVYKGQKVLIDQKTIPGVGRNLKFATSEDAKKVGDLVIQKLTKEKGFPSISLAELDSLKIKY